MITVDNDIKNNNLKQIYLLYGTEAYEKLEDKKKLLAAMHKDGDTMNYSEFKGKDIDPKEIISIADTLPFFADYRTILIQDSNFFGASDDTLCEYFKNGLPETTRVIFVENEIKGNNKFFKIIKNIGVVNNYVPWKEDALRRKIAELVNKEGKKIAPSLCNVILERTGNDLSTIVTELEKIFSYTLNKDEIKLEDINAVTPVALNSHIFALTEAIANKEQQKALHLYYEMLAAKEAPRLILTMIVRQFNLILQVKDLKGRKLDKNTICNKTGINSYFIQSYLNQSTKFKYRALHDILEDCAQTVNDINSGVINEQVGIELIIVKYSS